MLAGTLEIQMLLNMAKLTDQVTQAHGEISRFVGKIQGLLSTIGLGFGLEKVLETTLEFEKSSVRIDAILRATGNSAGFTRGQLDEMGKVLSHTSPFDDTQIRMAEVNLLKFGNIHGQTFKDALKATLDYAAATGKDLPSAAQALGRAVADPMMGLRRLSMEFGVLDYTTKKYIETALAHGEVEKARAAIIDFVMSKVGGTAEASNTGWTGVLARLAKAWDAVGEASERAIQHMQKNAQPTPSLLLGGGWMLAGKAVDALTPAAGPAKPPTWDEQYARQQAGLAEIVRDGAEKQNRLNEAHARAIPILQQWGLASGEMTRLQEANLMIAQGAAQFWTSADQKELRRLAVRRDLIETNKLLFQSDEAYLSQQERDRKQGEAALNEYITGAVWRHRQMEQDVKLIGMTAYEQEKLNALYEVQVREAAALKSLGTIEDTAEQAKAANAIMEASKRESDQILRDLARRREAERAWENGTKATFNAYIDNATNAAQTARDVFSGAFSAMENAVRVSNGRIVADFRAMTDLILTELLRIMIMRQAIAAGASLAGGYFASLFGGGATGASSAGGTAGGAGLQMPVTASYASGTDFVPSTGIYLLHRGEAVTPAGKSGSTFVIDARGADNVGLARLERMIRVIDGSIERRALSAQLTERMRRGSTE